MQTNFIMKNSRGKNAGFNHERRHHDLAVSRLDIGRCPAKPILRCDGNDREANKDPHVTKQFCDEDRMPTGDELEVLPDKWIEPATAGAKKPNSTRRTRQYAARIASVVNLVDKMPKQ